MNLKYLRKSSPYIHFFCHILDYGVREPMKLTILIYYSAYEFWEDHIEFLILKLLWQLLGMLNDVMRQEISPSMPEVGSRRIKLILK